MRRTAHRPPAETGESSQPPRDLSEPQRLPPISPAPRRRGGVVGPWPARGRRRPSEVRLGSAPGARRSAPPSGGTRSEGRNLRGVGVFNQEPPASHLRPARSALYGQRRHQVTGLSVTGRSRSPSRGTDRSGGGGRPRLEALHPPVREVARCPLGCGDRRARRDSGERRLNPWAAFRGHRTKCLFAARPIPPTQSPRTLPGPHRREGQMAGKRGNFGLLAMDWWLARSSLLPDHAK